MSNMREESKKEATMASVVENFVRVPQSTVDLSETWKTKLSELANEFQKSGDLNEGANATGLYSMASIMSNLTVLLGTGNLNVLMDIDRIIAGWTKHVVPKKENKA